MNSSLKKTLKDTYLQLQIDLKDKNNLESFLEDLLGEKVFEQNFKKLAVIYWLRKKRTKDIIKTNLEVADEEIKEAEKIMDKKGIKLAIKYLEAEEWANVWSDKIKELGRK